MRDGKLLIIGRFLESVFLDECFYWFKKWARSAIKPYHLVGKRCRGSGNLTRRGSAIGDKHHITQQVMKRPDSQTIFSSPSMSFPRFMVNFPGLQKLCCGICGQTFKEFPVL
jgi:hypothetical protein